MQAEIVQSIRAFVADNFLFREGRASIQDGESLIEAGLIDSTGILELVAFLENRFPIRIADEEMVPENLDSIQSIAQYVTRKLAANVEPAQAVA